jgi:Glyoxalase-like domain
MSTVGTRIDHLVVVAATLEQGVAWCEATLGITPGPGGEHPLMGTHNRLFRIATVDYPRAYFEIIAINPAAPDPVPSRAGRWFDMDNAALQQRVATSGPQLVHFVANVQDMDASLAALAAKGIDRGPALAASRTTPRGLLRWKITVRDDGQRLWDGTLPTLIQWQDDDTRTAHCAHPASGMPDSGVLLQGVTVTHPQAQQLREAYAAIGMVGVAVRDGSPNIAATLRTPRGLVTLQTEGI